jgi:hypothetical protein
LKLFGKGPSWQIRGDITMFELNSFTNLTVSKRTKIRRPDPPRMMKKSSRPDTKRPPNMVCKNCRRKAIRPEKIGGKWHFRSVPLCTNCLMLMNNYIDEISRGKRKPIKSVKEAEESFPLLMLDSSTNEYVGIFDNPKDLRKKLNSYRAENPNSEVWIIDMKFHDFTKYFIVPIR